MCCASPAVGTEVGLEDGLAVVGCEVGDKEGSEVGCEVGLVVVGAEVGFTEGNPEGVEEGVDVIGTLVGADVSWQTSTHLMRQLSKSMHTWSSPQSEFVLHIGKKAHIPERSTQYVVPSRSSRHS